jgi:hypothetical protein
MADPALLRFLEKALDAGVSREDASRALEQAGWSQAQIRDGLAVWADVAFPIPVPRPRPQASARDAFVYLVTFGALFLAAGHLMASGFAFVELALNDPLEPGTRGALSALRWSTAALLIAWPVFLGLSVRSARAIAQEPARRNSAVRRWLTFATLTFTAFVLIGDLVVLLGTFLSGGLGLGFLLKAGIVAAVAGGVFGYYLHVARTDDRALAR